MIETTNLPEILAEISEEVTYQEAPVLPDGTSAEKFGPVADSMGELAVISSLLGGLTMAQALTVPFFGVQSAEKPEDLRFELVKLSALAVAWINQIDNRKS